MTLSASGTLFVVRLRLTLSAMSVVVLTAGCGANAKSAAPPASAVTAAFHGSPAPLAALHARANRLLPGGTRAFDARLQALRGYPVVVNVWASWCGACRFEFPAYQKIAVTYGRRVAFIGVDERDGNASAAAFLHRFPVTYPSYTDPDGTIFASLHTYAGTPQTFFLARNGTQLYDKAGSYGNAAALERDVRYYLHVGR